MKQSEQSPAFYEALQLLTEGTAAATGDAFFRSLAQHAAKALKARYAFVAETLNPMESRSLAYWEGADFGEGFSYRFPGTPCQRVAAGNVCMTRDGLQEAYPDDKWLGQIGAVSYIGVPLKNADNKVLGHVAVLHTEPMHPSEADVAILKIFAARACAELERVQAERAMRDALSEVERLKERLQAENNYLQEEIRTEYNFEEILGGSRIMQALVRTIEQVASSNATVLITGETGTGKELVARALHSRSTRRDRPLVKVNCGAISAGLVESELFGHVKGAFTGALSNRIGRFELADGGIIFLDEVGELPADTQVKLLRVLQEQEFEPVGSNQTRKVNVRVIAATNRKLEDAVRDGQFRSDLFYRLNVVPLHVPALRERREDIPMLAEYFLQRYCQRLGHSPKGFASDMLRRMQDYDWPGNVRELQNMIERCAVLSPGPILNLEYDPLALHATCKSKAAPSSSPAQSSRADEVLNLQELERQHILTVLERSHWKIEGAQGAARLLGLNPSTVRSRMKKLGIKRAVT